MSAARLARWIAIVSMAMGSLASAGGAQAADPTPAPWPPVVIDGPAWAELMALPLKPEEALPFYAADLVEGWGRPVEAMQLRRALLHLHLRIAAGEPFPAASRIGDVWQQSRSTALSGAELSAAEETALNRGLLFEPVLAEPPQGGRDAGMARIGPRAPGFWVDPAGRRVAAHLRLRNISPVEMVPQSLMLRLRAAEPGLLFACAPTGSSASIPAGQSSTWWCEAEPPASPQALQQLRAGRGPALQAGQAEWVSYALQDFASARRMAQALTGRPPVFLQAFVERNASCEQQGECVRPRVVPPSAEKLAADRKRAIAETREDRKSARRIEALGILIPFAYLLVGIAIYVLVARWLGVIPAVALSLVQGPAVAYGFWARTGHINDYLELILLIMLVSSGVYIAGLGQAVYKRWFANL